MANTQSKLYPTANVMKLNHIANIYAKNIICYAEQYWKQNKVFQMHIEQLSTDIIYKLLT